MEAAAVQPSLQVRGTDLRHAAEAFEQEQEILAEEYVPPVVPPEQPQYFWNNYGYGFLVDVILLSRSFFIQVPHADGAFAASSSHANGDKDPLG